MAAAVPKISGSALNTSGTDDPGLRTLEIENIVLNL